MKKLPYLFIVLSLLFGGHALADTPAKAEASPQNLKTLVDYRSELNLSDSQISAINTALTKFRSTIIEERKLKKQYEKDYTLLIASQAPLDEIKVKLREITEVSFNLRLSDVVTTRTIENILSQEQLSLWKKIQTQVRAQHTSGS